MVAKKIERSLRDFFEWNNIKELVGLLFLVFLIRTFGFGLYQVPSGSMETTMLVGERFFADKFTYIFKDPVYGDILSMNDPTYHYSDNKIKRLFQEYVWGPSNWTKRVIGVPGDIIEGKIEDGYPVVYRNGKKINESYLNTYPLIRVWKEDKEAIRKAIQAQVSGWIANRHVSPSKISECIEQQMASRGLHLVSFDPEKSWSDQPFYRINPDRIYYKQDGEHEVLRAGTPLDRQEVRSRNRHGKNYWNGTDNYYVELGPNQYWCMGDNRLGSSDSRVFGPFERRLMHGRILFRIWSIDSNESWWIIDLIKNPVDFWSRIRWSRFFQWMS